MPKVTDAITGQPIFRGAPTVGLRNVGSYQVSGHPFLSGGFITEEGESKVPFPTVTKSVTVIASGSMNGDLRVHFVSTGSSDNVLTRHHYIVLDTVEDSVTFNVKCKEIYLSAGAQSSQTDVGFQLFAELTQIPTGSMFAITGAGHTDAP
jgi:hypothetical protein